MPYIRKSRRVVYDEAIDVLVSRMESVEDLSAGELNYIVTRLARGFVRAKTENYAAYNDVMGALEGVKMEMYRRSIVPYEDAKIREHGDVD